MVEHVWSTRGPVADCGTYRYTTGSGKDRRVHTWQFAAVRLEGPLPHMLLDARANNTFLGSNLPATFSADQRVSLGGEFDRHFDLYCPQGYGFDAFYLFTPDLMAHLIDHTQALDVEFVDEWMLLYSRGGLSPTEPRTWERLAQISDTVARLMRDRSRSYRDPRVAEQNRQALAAVGPVAGPPSIAPQGRRLRRGVAWRSIVFTAVVIIGYQLLRHLVNSD
nr:hypothetical protein [Auraticoccus cholistanensis]